MKKNIALAFLTPFFVAPVLILAQEETEAPAAEAPAAEATAEATEAAPAATEAGSNVVADTAEATAEVVADTAAAVVDTAGSIVEGAASVFERATTRDAWDIRLSVFAQYGDNRDSVPDHYDADVDERYRYKKEDDICFGIQPSAAFTGSFADNQHYKLGYSPIYQYWTNPRVGSKRNELSHAALAEYRYVHDTRNEFSVRDSFKYIQNDYWYLGTDDVEKHAYLNKRRNEHEQAHYDNTVTGLWRFQLTPLTAVNLSGYWNTIRYDDDFVASTEDEDKYTAILQLLRSYNAQWSYGLFLKYEAWDESGKSWNNGKNAVEDLPRGIETYTVGLSVAYRASGRLTIAGKYGWEWIDYEADSIDDRDFPGDGDISATYAFDTRTKGILGFRYGVTESWVYPFASQDLYSFYTVLHTRHTKDLSSAIRLEYKIAEYDTKYIPDEARNAKYMAKHEGEKKDLYADFSVTYRWSSKLDLTLSYSYEDVDSDYSTTYHENTVGARVTYLF
jgi:hypothetical protein